LQLVSNFVHELTEARADEELERRAKLYETLTGPKSAVDNARLRARALLKRRDCRLKLPDHDAPSVGPSRRELIEGQFVHVHRYPDDLPTVILRLQSLDSARWRLPILLEDVERLLTLPLSKAQKTRFLAWRQELLNLINRSSREHLFGSFVLAECQKALNRESVDHELFKTLLDRFMEEGPHLISMASEAAEYICLAAEGTTPDATSRAANIAPVERDKNSLPEESACSDAAPSWCHGADEEPPAEFPYGPLSGNKTDLAAAICPQMGYEFDPRALERLCSDEKRIRKIWIRKIQGQVLDVFFRDSRAKADAYSSLIKVREEKKKKKQEKQEEKKKQEEQEEKKKQEEQEEKKKQEEQEEKKKQEERRRRRNRRRRRRKEEAAGVIGRKS